MYVVGFRLKANRKLTELVGEDFCTTQSSQMQQYAQVGNVCFSYSMACSKLSPNSRPIVAPTSRCSHPAMLLPVAS